ncbi:hypothetical protein BJX76DRAFT_332327 [Aspergillus varians]
MTGTVTCRWESPNSPSILHTKIDQVRCDRRKSICKGKVIQNRVMVVPRKPKTVISYITMSNPASVQCEKTANTVMEQIIIGPLSKSLRNPRTPGRMKPYLVTVTLLVRSTLIRYRLLYRSFTQDIMVRIINPDLITKVRCVADSYALWAILMKFPG